MAIPAIITLVFVTTASVIFSGAKFVSEYEAFIRMGAQYYQKFDSIISNYENKDKCSDKLPSHFNELQYDIQNTIDKFQNTYNLPEITGSRMKSLLYGIN